MRRPAKAGKAVRVDDVGDGEAPSHRPATSTLPATPSMRPPRLHAIDRAPFSGGSASVAGRAACVAGRAILVVGLTVLVVGLTVLVGGTRAPISAQPVPGEVTEAYVSDYDGRSRHALYVPSGYSADRSWPLVLIMDARGRALVPLERMIPAAERWGYILVSSYDTASDGPSEPNAVAVEAMLEDAQDLFAIDARRLYFVGFSGTARQAWTFGRQLAAYTHGVIGFGAGLPSPTFLLTTRMDGGPPPFAFFGGAGDLDFNYEEVRRLDDRLDDSGIPHRMRFYDGPHAWPGEEVFADALEWMVIQAARAGLVQRSPAELDTLYEARASRADSLAAVGDLLGAVDAYRALVDGFDGLRPTTGAADALERILASDGYDDERDRLQEILREREAFDERFAAFLDDARDDDGPFDVGDAVELLGLDERLDRSGGGGPDALPHRPESSDSQALLDRRILDAVYVRASFYEPAALLDDGAWEKAEAFYRLADRIRPDRPRVCLGLARVHAQTGQVDEAFTALECAAASGGLAASDLRTDELLAPLRDDERFQAILRRLEGR